MRRVSLYIIYVLLVAGLLVGIILAFRSQHLTEPSAKPGPVPTISKAPAAEQPVVTSTPSVESSNSSNSAAAANPNPAGSSQELTNTGPGDVLAVFIGSAVVASVGFSTYQKRKNNIY